MPKEKKESIEVTEISAPAHPLAPLFANVVSTTGHPSMVLIDLGFYAPSYRKPYNLEDTQVARLCIDWDTARLLAKNLDETISEHDQEIKPKKTKKK